MELRDLRYFVVVAERLNIAHAAEALDMSSTALGKSLRRLEKSVGAKLVERAGNGVALTAVGTALLAQIGPLQGIMNDLRKQVAALASGEAGHVKVGVNYGLGENVLADACIAVSQHTKKITLAVTRAGNANLVRELRKGLLDLFLTAGPPVSDEFNCERLFDIQDVVVASANHSLTQRPNLSLRDVAEWRWIANTLPGAWQWPNFVRMFDRHRIPAPTIALVTDSETIRFAAVAYADYLTVASREYVRREARRYPLAVLSVKEMTDTRSMSIVTRKGAYLSPAARRLIEILREQAQEVSNMAIVGVAARKRKYSS